MPAHAKITLGRFDLKGNVAPDVDLSWYDQGSHLISRRHARIVGRHDRHYIEDLHSANGTKLNGIRIENSEFGPLNPGDHIWLGGCVLVYGTEMESQPTGENVG